MPGTQPPVEERLEQLLRVEEFPPPAGFAADAQVFAQRGMGAKDPIVGANEESATFAFPSRPIPRRLRGLSRFVVTRGGEYAFIANSWTWW